MAPCGTTRVVSVDPSRLHAIGQPRVSGARWLVAYMSEASGEIVSAIGDVPVGMRPITDDGPNPAARAFASAMTVIDCERSSAMNAMASSGVTLAYTRPITPGSSR